MEKQLNKIEAKIDKLDERLDNIDITLGKQAISLNEHMRRTELLETEIKPIKALTHQIVGAGKLMGLIALISSIVGVILKYFSK